MRHTDDGIRVTKEGDPFDPENVRRYLQKKFGDDMDRIEDVMQELAKAYRPKELADETYLLYEQFRPEILIGDELSVKPRQQPRTSGLVFLPQHAPLFSFHKKVLAFLRNSGTLVNTLTVSSVSSQEFKMVNGNGQVETSFIRVLSKLREKAGLTQAELAAKVAFSTATICRIESGEKVASPDELEAILKAIDSEDASHLTVFLKQNWDFVARPAFDHPDREALWEANMALRQLANLREDPDLKGVFVRQIDLYEAELDRLLRFLESRDHQIAFIGSIGVGKSTAICKLTDLLKDGEEKLDRQIVLETGAGGITLCEVHVSQGPRYGLRIVPRSEDSIRRDVEDLCEYLVRLNQPDAIVCEAEDDDGDPLGISKEVVRAIRNMAGLAEKRQVVDGKRVRIDPAKELVRRYPTVQELTIQVLTRMDLLRRTRRDEWYPDDALDSPEHWMQTIFSAINNGRHPEFTIPEKIEVIVPDPVFGSRELPLRLIDTKGIDQTAERQDLECHFYDSRTLVVLATRFNDAPDVAVQSLLQRAKDGRARDVSQKTALLVLPRPEESLAVKYDDGARVEDDEEGYELKADQVRLRLNQRGLNDLPVLFFNAREDSAATVRKGLLGQIAELRSGVVREIKQLARSVDHLVENQKDEQVRLVFEHISGDLSNWVENHQEFLPHDEGVEEPLIEAINGTRYASTVRAAVLRAGEWSNLDYYHHLAYGIRKLAVCQIGDRIEEFKVIVGNLASNNDHAQAREFLDRLVAKLDAAADDSYRRIQSGGKEAFKRALGSDHLLWSECEGFWGMSKIRGKGFRLSVSETTESRFGEHYDDAHKLLVNLIDEEWGKIVGLLNDMLREKDATAFSDSTG